MGCVYRVHDEALGRRLALKRLLVGAQRDQAALLFAREYHTLASLKHPRVIEVYDFGVDALGPYYTMELLEGSDLRELAPLDYRTACRHLRDIASSLALLHARRLLHRDISARNVRVTADGRCKLIDFGALTSFGVSGDLVGTPPNIAPEAVRGDSLDQRADLYALGTLAYGLLSGRQAYPARRLEDLIDVWKTPPVPLSELVREIPIALEQLVTSLISHDPMARPVTAAEVIERLDAIAELEAEDEVAVAEGYLVSPALVGRTTELNHLRRHLTEAVEGHGSALLIEGTLGTGKTRLLGELALQAHTLGAAVVHVDAEMHERSFGVLEALATRLLDHLPEQATAAARPHAQILAQLSPAIRKRLDMERDVAIPQLPGEWRGRVQSAMETWIGALSALRPLLIAVDNVQIADPPSLALIASLARTAKARRLLVACSLRISETIAAPDAMRLLREHAQSIPLNALGPDDVLTLVRSLFGEVPNHGRLAQWIYDSAAGNPRHSVELARHLAESGAAHYVNGIWTLTDDLSGIAPPDLSALAGAVLQGLSDDARDFAAALSVQHRPLPLDVCMSLWKEPDERVFHAFDELIARGVLRNFGDDCGFSQQSVRTRLQEALPDERRRALHARLAELLLKGQPDDPRVGLEAGWHLLRAGEETRGADLLARAARRTHAVGTINDDFHAAVPALEAALSVYRKEQRSPYQIVPLLTSLARAGYYVDRRLATTYGEAALELLPRLTGLTLATRLRPALGPMLSLVIGVLWARLAFKVSRAPREYQFRELFVFLFSCVTTLSGVAAICLDPERCARYANTLKPMLVAGPDKTPAGIYDYCLALGQIATDHWDSTRSDLRRLYERFTDDTLFRSLPDDARKLYVGGLAYSNGVVEALRDSSTALEWADRLERLDLKLYEMIAQHVRALHHAGRGEFDKAREYSERLDVHAVQAGSAWQVEIWAPAGMILPYLAAQDVLGLKRSAEQLARLAEEIPSLGRYARLAHAAYLLCRGDHQRALQIHEILSQEEPRARAGWAGLTGSLASVYNELGDPARAKQICEDALRQIPNAERAFAIMNMRLEIELARARAALGEVEEAAAALDCLLEEHRASQNPLTMGLIHGARARIAVVQKDIASFTKHKEQMERWFRTTRNPALIAQCETLEKLAVQAGMDVGPVAGAFVADSFENITRSLIVGSRTPTERAQRALDLVLRETRGKRGFLFERDAGGLRLVASVSERPPSTELEQSLAQKVTDAQDGVSVRSDGPTEPRHDRDLDSNITRQLGMVLSTNKEGRLVVYGAVAIEGPDLAAPSYPFLQAIARGMLGLSSFREAELAAEGFSTDVTTAHTRRLN